MVNAFRYGFLGISDVEVRLAFLIVGGTLLALLLWALVLLRRGTGLSA
jgi:ABC-2 type transport system permease protein